MSEQQDKEQSIEQLSAELKRGLSLCHSVVDELRLKLAANSNEAEAANEADQDENRHG